MFLLFFFFLYFLPSFLPFFPFYEFFSVFSSLRDSARMEEDGEEIRHPDFAINLHDQSMDNSFPFVLSLYDHENCIMRVSFNCVDKIF